MRRLIPFVTVDNAANAIEFYKEVFQAKVIGEITMLDQVPGMNQSKYKIKIGHCSLQIGDSKIYIIDSLEEYQLKKGDQIQFVLNMESKELLNRSFDKLKKEGIVLEKLQKVFWGALFGTVKDKFEVTWQLYCEN